MTRTSHELTKFTLVACDMSYAADNPGVGFVGSPLQEYRDTENYDIPIPFSILSGYVVDKLFVDAARGFKAIALRGPTDVILAFAGVDGTNLQDWKETLKFGWNQWNNNRTAIFSYLDGLRASNGIDPFVGKIHFTGQSLGGGLAEFAAYEFLARASSQTGIDAFKSRVTVTTFNGFGGTAILAQELPDFESDMLANLSESAAYYIANDVISRLGVSHVGIQEYLLDYRSANLNPKTGLKYYLDPFDTHRIEPGFYRNYSPVLGFESEPVRSSKIIIPQLQQAVALWAGIFSEKTNAPGDAKWRLPAGVIGGVLIAPTEEVQELSREVIAAFDRAGAFDARPGDTLIEVAKRKISSILAVSAANVATELSRPSMHKAVAGLFAVALGADANGRAAISDGFRKVVGVDVALSSLSDSELLLQSRLTLAAIPGVVDQDIDASGVFAGLNLDISTYADKIFSDRAGWLDDTLKYLEAVEFQSYQTADERVSFEAALVNYVQQENASLADSGDVALQNKVTTALQDFEKNFAQALANTRSDFDNKYILADASAFGIRQFDFVAYDQYHDALEQVALDPEFSDIEPLLEDALDIVESAGLTVVLSAERPSANPFDVPGFDPDVAQLPQEEVQEGGIKRFTLSLPYGAGVGGQRIAVTLDGKAGPHFKLLAGAEEVVAQDGVYTVVVEEGRRELELAVWGQIDVSEGGTLSLSATLVDEAGQATHRTHTEASVQFLMRDDLVFDGPPTSVFTDASETVLFSVPGARLYVDGAGGNDVFWGDIGEDNRFLGGAGDDRLFGSFRLYQGNNDRDWLSGGSGNDQLLGGEDDDILEGDAGSDILLGDVGDDFLFAGSKADYATIFTVGGLDPTGDLVQGGAGKDLVVGAAGADQLSGGNDADLMIGGAGNDEMRGDTEFIPTHFFHIIGSTFPPQQPLAGAADVLYGNGGLDTLLGEAGADRLYGGEGGDTLIGGEGQDELYGGAGDDFLVGDADSLDPLVHTDDFLRGGEGNDYLRGQGGSDTLIGDAGEDRLDGGGEADLYVFNRGDGVDTIFDEGSNTIRFGPGIDAEDLELGLGSLYIRIGDSGDAIRIENFNPDDALGSYAVDSFEFFNGEQLTYAQLIERGFDLAGTDEDDAISGTNVTDRISGGGGHDMLDGGAGADMLSGGAGDDVYVVDEPGDLIHEAQDEGNDAVESSAVSYVLGPNLENLVLTHKEHRPDDDEESPEGEEGGQVVITGGIAGTGNELDNQIFGNVLDNVLDGGAGYDFLAGDFGSDTYRFGRGSGVDTIVEFDDTPGNLDSVQFAPDVAPADVAVLREADHLVLSIRNSVDQVTLLNWFASDAEKVEQASFADGTVWDVATLEAMAEGQNSAPVVSVPIADQTAQENAAFAFTIPADTFSDPGNTLVIAAARADGTPLPGWLSFDAATQGFSGIAANNDVGTLDIAVTATDAGGLSASDTFTLTVANINDAPVLAAPIADQGVLEDAAFSFTLPQGTFADVDAGDFLTLAAGLADGSTPPAWLAFDPVSGTFIGTPGNGDVGALNVRVTATDAAGAAASDEFVLEVVNVNDAPSLTAPLPDQFANQNAAFSLQVPGTTFMDPDAGDALTLNAALAAGGALPTWLAFDSATRTFSGTPSEFDVGEVELRVAATDPAGAAVSDTFALSVSDASTVNETHLGTRRRDVIVTGFANDLIDAGRGDDLVRAGAGRDIVFGGNGDDWIAGEAGNDVLEGGEGHDWLLGASGDDALAGGEGNDRLEGGIGGDLYVHEQRGGHDVIEETGADADTLRLSAGITADIVKLSRRHDDLVVDLSGPHGSVTVKGWFDSNSKQVERIEFADGTAWGVQDIGERVKRKRSWSGQGRDDDHDQGHHQGRDDHHGKSDGREHEDRDDDRSEREPDRVGDLLEAYLAQKPHYDFETLAQELERSERRGEALDAQEIARRWQAVARYANGLANEHDEEARGGAVYRFNEHGLLGGGAFGGGFGYTGSTGMARGSASLRTLQGLEEGFQRLHS